MPAEPVLPARLDHRRAFRPDLQHQRQRPALYRSESASADEGRPSIILTASIAASKGMEAFSVYSATKAAVRSFARTGPSI